MRVPSRSHLRIPPIPSFAFLSSLDLIRSASGANQANGKKHSFFFFLSSYFSAAVKLSTRLKRQSFLFLAVDAARKLRECNRVQVSPQALGGRRFGFHPLRLAGDPEEASLQLSLGVWCGGWSRCGLYTSIFIASTQYIYRAQKKKKSQNYFAGSCCV